MVSITHFTCSRVGRVSAVKPVIEITHSRIDGIAALHEKGNRLLLDCWSKEEVIPWIYIRGRKTSVLINA